MKYTAVQDLRCCLDSSRFARHATTARTSRLQLRTSRGTQTTTTSNRNSETTTMSGGKPVTSGRDSLRRRATSGLTLQQHHVLRLVWQLSPRMNSDDWRHLVGVCRGEPASATTSHSRPPVLLAAWTSTINHCCAHQHTSSACVCVCAIANNLPGHRAAHYIPTTMQLAYYLLTTVLHDGNHS